MGTHKRHMAYGTVTQVKMFLHLGEAQSLNHSSILHVQALSGIMTYLTPFMDIDSKILRQKNMSLKNQVIGSEDF